MCKLKAGAKARRCKALPSHLRSLFQFLFWSGRTKRDLARSLPRVATAIDHLPRYLKVEEIERLIDSVRSDDAVGRLRDVVADGSAGASRPGGHLDPA